MTQFVLLILPEHDDEKARAVGPFLAEHLAKQWANARDIAHSLRLIMPLEEVKHSVYNQGRHALIPSPVPRSVLCGTCGRPFLPSHSVAAPGPTMRHPFRTPATSPEEVAAASWEAKKRAARGTDLSAGGRPMTSWIEEHADQLRRFAPQQLPTPPEDA